MLTNMDNASRYDLLIGWQRISGNGTDPMQALAKEPLLAVDKNNPNHGQNQSEQQYQSRVLPEKVTALNSAILSECNSSNGSGNKCPNILSNI